MAEARETLIVLILDGCEELPKEISEDLESIFSIDFRREEGTLIVSGDAELETGILFAIDCIIAKHLPVASINLYCQTELVSDACVVVTSNYKFLVPSPSAINRILEQSPSSWEEIRLGLFPGQLLRQAMRSLHWRKE